MREAAKSPVLILVILIVVSLLLAGTSFFVYQKEHAKSLSLTEELDDLKARQKMTEAKLEEAKKALSMLETRLKESQDQITGLTSDLQRETAARHEAASQIAQFRSELEQQKSLRSELEDKFNGAQKEVDAAKAQLKELDAKKTELEAKVAELQVKSADLENKMQGVELGKIVVSPDKKAAAKSKADKKDAKREKAKLATAPVKESAAVPSGLEGKILVVNKDYNFAVINLGTKDGVAMGDVFNVSRNNKYLGEIKVNKVHDSMAAADFSSDQIKEAANEGDKVVQKMQ